MGNKKQRSMRNKQNPHYIRGAIFYLASAFLTFFGGGKSFSLENYIAPNVGIAKATQATEQSYPVNFMAGIDYGLDSETTGLGLRVGTRVFQSSAPYVKTSNLLARLVGVFNPVRLLAPNSKVTADAYAGINFLGETSTIDVPNFLYKRVNSATWGISLGVDVTLMDRINAEVGYNVFPASKNAKGVLDASIGYRYTFGKK